MKKSLLILAVLAAATFASHAHAKDAASTVCFRHQDVQNAEQARLLDRKAAEYFQANGFTLVQSGCDLEVIMEVIDQAGGVSMFSDELHSSLRVEYIAEAAYSLQDKRTGQTWYKEYKENDNSLVELIDTLAEDSQDFVSEHFKGAK